jgi:hypothetical protein
MALTPSARIGPPTKLWIVHAFVIYTDVLDPDGSKMARFPNSKGRRLAASAARSSLQRPLATTSLIISACVPALATYATGILPDYAPLTWLVATAWGLIVWTFVWLLRELTMGAHSTAPTAMLSRIGESGGAHAGLADPR